MIALLPPWPIWLVEFSAIVGLLTLSLRIPQQQRQRSVWLIAFSLAIVVTIALGIYWGGFGHTWGLPSVIGKFVASFLAAALPVFSAAVAIHVANCFGLGVKTTSILSISMGLVAVLPMVFVGVVLACGLTGDCL
jgi:hypothetical protein